MPILKWFPPQGAPRTFVLYKPVTTVGRALGNDVAIPSSELAETHAQILFDGRDFNLEEADKQAEILLNGKKKRRARLVHGDRITLGEVDLAFGMFDEPDRVTLAAGVSAPSPEGHCGVAGPSEVQVTGQQLAGLHKLYEFSEKLMTMTQIDQLLEAMLDAVIEVTGAEKGLILLHDDAYSSDGPAVEPSSPGPKGALDPSGPVIRAARSDRRETIAEPKGSISDSIVRKVLESGRPLIVSDALTDAEFNSSESVLALRLSSVMCAPLVSQGQVQGVLYVGNDRVKGLFDRHQLDVLSIFAGQASLILQNALLLNALRADKEKLVSELKDKRFGEIIGSCPSMLEVFRKLQKVATTDISVLITGETGTGKELIAHEIHRRSSRATGPFVVINCGAIPEALIESELFGHVRGAFTGAVASRPGKFQVANRGTLFLDEIGELPQNLQVKLLRALQERVVYRVGDSRPEKVDIRVVAATNRVLEHEIEAGRFREDLYYRLNVVNLYLPPLRERGDDVLILAKALLSKYAEELHSTVHGFTPQALAGIKKYPWPGNIRQLENRIKKALVLCESSLLSQGDLDFEKDSESSIVPLEKAKEEFQRKYVLEALERNSGNRTQTARDLGVDPRTIFRFLERETNPPPAARAAQDDRVDLTED
ncbi:MAG: sigma 54-interacting transcriptional regulator [Polyangiaceae bacterium]|jgi:transcriptional regulator with GAF, ATPase, and Fis domain